MRPAESRWSLAKKQRQARPTAAQPAEAPQRPALQEVSKFMLLEREVEIEGHVDRSQLAVAELGVDYRAVGHWTPCGKIALFVGLRQIPFGYDGVLPELAAVFPVECRNREYGVRRGTVARTRRRADAHPRLWRPRPARASDELPASVRSPQSDT